MSGLSSVSQNTLPLYNLLSHFLRFLLTPFLSVTLEHWPNLQVFWTWYCTFSKKSLSTLKMLHFDPV